MLNEITLSEIIAWLEQQPPERKFYAGRPHLCLVNQYVADCLGMDKSSLTTGLQTTRTIGVPEQDIRIFEHSEEIRLLIIRFDHTGNHMGQIISARQALEIARSIQEEQEQRKARPAPVRKMPPINGIYLPLPADLVRDETHPVLLDLSVPLEQRQRVPVER